MEPTIDNQTTPPNAVHDAIMADEGQMVQFLTFTLGDEEYGVDIMRIREVKGWTNATRLPNMPNYIRGVLNLRGMILPIFDLRTRFTGEPTNATEEHVIVIIAVKDRIVGVLADSVSDIITIGSHEIKPAPSMENDLESQFVNGLIAREDRMVVLLDMEKLIDDEIINLATQNTSATKSLHTQTEQTESTTETSHV